MRHKPQKINVLLALVVLCLGALTGTVIIVPDAGKTGECANNFVRETPNFCRASAVGITSLTQMNNTCLQDAAGVGLHIVPASSTMALMAFDVAFVSNNAAALRQVTFAVFDDVSCTNTFESDQVSLREFSAVAGGTSIGEYRLVMLVPLTVANSFNYKIIRDNATNLHQVNGRLLGYYD